MTADRIVPIDDVNFLEATAGSYTVVDFWAPWCGPCHQFAPVFEAAATKYGDRIRFGKCDVDESPTSAAMVGITSIPTMVVFDVEGNELTRLVGLVPPRQLDGMLAELVELVVAADGTASEER